MSEEFRTFNKQMLDENETTKVVGTGTDGDAPQFTGESTEEIVCKDEEATTTEQPTTEAETTSQNEEKQPSENSAPKLTTGKEGYHGFFLAPMNHLERIKAALLKMAETDEELDKAIKEGKKTFEGCDRYIRNNMKDLAREMGQQEIVFDHDSVHAIARYYMVTTDNLDVQNAAKAVTKAKEDKPKKEAKPKKEKKTKVIPLTPQMGNLFGDDDFK